MILFEKDNGQPSEKINLFSESYRTTEYIRQYDVMEQ